MRVTVRKEAPKPSFRKEFQNYQKLGFWATVTEVNSQSYTCTVLTSNREVIRNIPLASKEWISDDSAERNLPPIGSFVFILMPDNCISNAFILCSGYPKGESALQGLYAQNEDEKKEKDNKRESVTPSHWNETEDYVSGTRTITSPDGKISITATLKNKETDSLVIKCFDSVLTMNKDGIVLNPKKIDIDVGSGDISLTTTGDVSVNANSVNINNGALEITKS